MRPWGEGGLKKLVNIQVSPPPNSRDVHPNEHEVRKNARKPM